MHYTLIGMSGSGKSHLGKQLAQAFGYEFFDVDTAMETLYQKPLQVVLNELGDDEFLREQAMLVKQSDFSSPHIIATGGSVVYTDEAMQHLKDISRIIFIDVPLSVIESRVDTTNRGVVGLGAATFAELYELRRPLYQKWADMTIAGDSSFETILSCIKN